MYDVLEFHNAAGYIRDLVVKPLFMVIFALLVGAAASKSERPERFLVPMLISIWATCPMFIGLVFLSPVGLETLAAADSRGLLTMLGPHPNELGPLYAFAYALLLFTWAESKKLGLRLVLLASMGMLVVALTLTFSRAAYAGFIVVNALFLLWHRRAKTLVLLGLLAAVALLLLPGAVYNRVTLGFGEGLDTISAGRINYIWLPLFSDVLRSPIYGNGLGSIIYSETMREGSALTGQAHNAYLETVLDMGIAGLVLLCAYFVHVWKGFRALSVDPAVSPTQRGFYQGAAAGLACFLATGITSGFLTPADYQIFLWLAIGMMYGQRARKTDDVSISRQHVQAGIPTQPACAHRR